MTISLAIIARNESRCIGRALASVVSLVDEMIVLDTGSEDDTWRIAHCFGADVQAFTWVDDFSAARNAALARTRGKHTLVLDADEWVETDTNDAMRSWSDRANEKDAGSVIVHSPTQSDGHLLSTTITSIRLLPRGASYKGRIHEHPHGFNRVLPVPGLEIQHDGYEAEQISRKRGRNERLLLAELKANPQNDYLRFQLGRERQLAGDFYQASRLYESVVSYAVGQVWENELKARLLYTLGQAGRTDDALSYVAKFMAKPRFSAEVLFAVGNVYLDIAVQWPWQARRFVALAVQSWRGCLEIGEAEGADDSTVGCGSFLAAENLAAVYEAQGDEAGRRLWATRAQEFRLDAKNVTANRSSKEVRA